MVMKALPRNYMNLVGDEVVYIDSIFGHYQDNCAECEVVNEHHLARKPFSFDFVHAADLRVTPIRRGKRSTIEHSSRLVKLAFIRSAGGCAQHLAIRLAGHRGARVAATGRPSTFERRTP